MKNKAVLIITCVALSGNFAKASTKKGDDRPNILFIIADDASFQHFGAYGCKWVRTPAFDRVSREGLLFNKCYTSNAKSTPSRSSILTGLYSWESGAAANHNPYFPEDLKVVTESLAENGYNVAFTGKGWAPGNPGEKNDEKRLLTGKPYQKRKLIPPSTGIHTTDYVGNFSDFLDEVESDKPWFFWFGCYEPHRAYEFGSGNRLGGKNITDIDNLPLFFPDNQIVRTDMLDYAYEIEYFDKQIEGYLMELEKRSLLDNTIIIITSDNGMPFPRCKGNNYEYSNHMPLAIMWKNGIVNSGRKIDDYVNFVDFAPTFMEVSKSKDMKLKPGKGRSLCDIFYSKKSGIINNYRNFTILGRERHDYGRPQNQGYPIRAIIQNDLLYIINFKPQLLPAGNPETGYADCDGSPTKTEILTMQMDKTNSWYYKLSFELRNREELYDLSIDPDCVINLSENQKYKKAKEELKILLLSELENQNDPRVLNDGDIFDKYPYSEPVGVNFWEKVTQKEISEPWEITKGWLNPTDYSTYTK